MNGTIQLLCSALGTQSSCKDDWVLIRAAWSSQNIPVILAEIPCAEKEWLVLSFWTSVCILDGIMIKKKSFWPVAWHYFSMQITKSPNFAYLLFHQGSRIDSGDTASLTLVTNILLLSALIMSLYLTAFLICWRDCVPWRIAGMIYYEFSI